MVGMFRTDNILTFGQKGQHDRNWPVDCWEELSGDVGGRGQCLFLADLELCSYLSGGDSAGGSLEVCALGPSAERKEEGAVTQQTGSAPRRFENKAT